MDKDKLPETIDITPDWQGMFRFAERLCRDAMDQGDGRDLVVEMLNFGARLEAARSTSATEGGQS